MHIDNTFVITKKSQLVITYDLANNAYSDVRFKLETNLDNKLPFLSLLITKISANKLE